MSSTKRAPYRANIQFLDGSTRSFGYYFQETLERSGFFRFHVDDRGRPQSDCIIVNPAAIQTIDQTDA